MKVYIQTDIEGVAGFCFFEDRANGSSENIEHRMRMRRLLTHEVDAAVKASFAAGADEVLVNDSHGSGYNILFEELDPRCRIIHGRNCSGPHWLPLLEGSDALVLIGMHAMGGTPVSITPHSLWKIDGGRICLGEGTMAAAIAGDLGIPTVFVSGDDKVTAEFREKIPAVEALAVKQALSPYQACSLIPSKACELIGQGVRRALERRGEIAPYVIPGPVTLSLFDSDGHVPPLREIMPPVTAGTVGEAFLEYEKKMPWTTFDLRDPDGFVYPGPAAGR
ncbi:MAG: M55 family metallopeptidase [Lentisphaeria bacterium]|nr:M55 family metallopeptidase [Lentisphaeria bacterium]